MAKNEKKKNTKKEQKEGLFHSVKVELSKVKWPTGKEMVKYTFATLIFCIILALFFQGVDLLASFIKGLF